VAGRCSNPTRIDARAHYRRRRRRVTAALASAALAPSVAVGFSACGRGVVGGASQDVSNRPAPPGTVFPPAGGKTLDQIVSSADAQRSNLVVSPTATVYERGHNRFGFGVFTVGRQQVPNATVALYAAATTGGEALGPFPARLESLRVRPRFESRTTKRDPDAAKFLYVSHVDFRHDGEWSVVALFRQGDAYSAAPVPPSVEVGRPSGIPAVGGPPPAIHTPTVADVHGHLSRIDTRNPPDDMHRVDFAQALGREPIVLMFATPALCRSNVCGPVVDVAQEVEHRTHGVAFIHQEVYRHNNASDGVRPQLRAFGLRTEPWLFVVNRRGVITTRIEGAFDARELERAVHRVGG
jgi:hypothetical protein